MADKLLFAAVVLGAGVLAYLLVLARRKTFAGDMAAPMDLEKARAGSEAEMTAPISKADAAAAAPLIAFVKEIGTGEQRLVSAFDADPLSAPIPEGRHVAEPALFNHVTAEWLSLFTWSPRAAALPISSVHVPEPEPLELESFSVEWTTGDIARMVAEATAAAR